MTARTVMKLTSLGEESKDQCRNLSTRRKNNPDFAFTTYFLESHGKIIYAVEFCNNLTADQPIIFATCGSNVVSIYECRNDGRIKLLQCYEDSSSSEQYFALAWSFDPNAAKPMLAVAGFNRVIRIIYPTAMTSDKHLIGHGLAINDLKFHPKDPRLLLSASRDDSVRLWNVQTGVCIVIFKGIDGHKSEVLSADFDDAGNRIATSGIDHSVCVWQLNKPSIQEAIRASFNGQREIKSTIEHFPEFSVDHIHKEYVDCVKWLGNLILSKSNENAIVCWKPGCLQQTAIDNASIIGSVIHKFQYHGDQYFFLRFSLDARMTYMAVGNGRGTTFLWKMNGNEPEKPMHLRHPSCTATVRSTAFSRDAKILISVCDDGSVWKWDRIDPVG